MVETEAEGVALYIRHLEAQAAGDHSEAGRLLRAAVALGDPLALHAAAFQADAAAAVPLYEAASRAGYAPSAWNLYLHYREVGDDAKAAHWLKEAAKLGDEDAVKLLADRASP